MTDQVNCFLTYLFLESCNFKVERKLTGCLARDLSGNNQEAVLYQARGGSCE